MRNLLTSCFAAFAICLMTTACNEDKPSYPVEETMFDIVTLTSVSDNGFTVTTQKIDDSPLVTLNITNTKIDTSAVKLKERFLLGYVPESGVQYLSGPVTAVAYRPILNAKIIEGTKNEYNSWATEAQDIVSMWRTGNFINVSALAAYSQIPAKYELVVDKETLENEVPQAYIIFNSDNVYESAPREYYASFDISSLWAKESVRGLRVTVPGLSTPQQSFTFTKEGSETIQPNN